MKIKNIKIKSKVAGIIFSVFALLCLTQCCSAKRLQAEAPITFGEVYYKNWVAGVEGGGSGINLFIEVLSNDIVLDSVYFRGVVSKLDTKPINPLLYIGRFLSDFNNGEENQISDVPVAENEEESSIDDFPFKLENDECVVSYQINDGKTKYYKLKDIVEKPSEEYPSVKNSEMDHKLN